MSRIEFNNKQDLQNKCEDVYDKAFQNYISPAEYEKKTTKHGYYFEEIKGYEEPIKRIRELILRGHFIKSGYMATSVKDFHKHYIIWKP